MLQHLELVYQSLLMIPATPPEIFTMKFSPIPPTIAANVSVAIAAPGPLHARALEQINSFEHDVDIYSSRGCRPLSVKKRLTILEGLI